MKNLENKVGQGKPDWKQWIPAFGIYQVFQDLKDNKPAMMEGKPEFTPKEFAYIAYQTATTSTCLFLTCYALYSLAEKLI